MRHFTKEELEIYKKLENKNLPSEEREKLLKELFELEEKVTNGMTWLT